MGKRKRTALETPWESLPADLTANILQRMDAVEMVKCSHVCRSWRRVCRDPSMWRAVDLDNMMTVVKHRHHYKNWDRICREAVDLSQGQLISITLGSFATNDLLLYIAQRAKQLRTLSVKSMYINRKEIRKAVKEFPMMEELELKFPCPQFSKKDFEAIAHSCPMLKSFSIIKYYVDFPSKPCDEEALAIAVNMSGLKRLSLVGNGLSGSGLTAILDACPHLESLKLLCCYHVRLKEDLKKRCSQQIKDFEYRL